MMAFSRCVCLHAAPCYVYDVEVLCGGGLQLHEIELCNVFHFFDAQVKGYKLRYLDSRQCVNSQ